MSYSVHEIFHTLQGEGAQSGRAAVFCRFAGCNLWSGREVDRRTAVCRFCDTEFRGTVGPNGGRFDDANSLAERIGSFWPQDADSAHRFVVCTGGEPLLQLDAPLIDALHAQGFAVAVETNGTQPAPAGIDWLCVSPKSTALLELTTGNELKLVFPQPDAPPERFADLDFEHFFLQPMDGPEREANTVQAIAYCKAHPRWRLSLQTHKWLGIP
ncbi:MULTISPECIES: 7-carboxy-7-deazaguanine synthase [Thiorhodovibrio]|uniref:7-carboxy-7-deazaguanine synthase n=1 Tax=Thiorhodovibrio TaxID=61593 RepID=UPI0019142B6C|nr:7-carboxy-7-deazaguanine synthase [Thiorhodovibrio litoralis]MBK5970732.1 7-carboxy-7-deazaguanine synthase [Thiorhodovibrio winogradskyi]WPL14580.1 7-carboxy-7-deazaguanine synthase [Thiorhodovibrio litoralis]